MNKKLFTINKYTGDGKRIFISSPESNFQLMMDNDDVEHYIAAANLRKALEILNKHWEDSNYANLNPKSYPQNGDEITEEFLDARYVESIEILNTLRSK